MSSDTHPYAEAMSKALAQCHADWKAADRRKRINDLAARYAGEMAGGAFTDPDCVGLDYAKLAGVARALAAAVVEAEE